eukprot:2036569-Alexandrium_andersonii.AAC.1
MVRISQQIPVCSRGAAPQLGLGGVRGQPARPLEVAPKVQDLAQAGERGGEARAVVQVDRLGEVRPELPLHHQRRGGHNCQQRKGPPG